MNPEDSFIYYEIRRKTAFFDVFVAPFEKVTIFIDVSDSKFCEESEYATLDTVNPEDFFIYYEIRRITAFFDVFEAHFEKVTIFIDVSDSKFCEESEYATLDTVNTEDYFIPTIRLLVPLCAPPRRGCTVHTDVFLCLKLESL